MLVERLPATWAALADGELDWSRARGLAAELSDAARELEPEVLARIEAAVLPGAASSRSGPCGSARGPSCSAWTPPLPTGAGSGPSARRT